MRERKRRLWHASPWDGQPGLWAAFRRLVYQFEGPSQLGDPNEPAYIQAKDPKCPVCSQSLTLHRIERGGPGKPTHMKCPPKTDSYDGEADVPAAPVTPSAPETSPEHS